MDHPLDEFFDVYEDATCSPPDNYPNEEEPSPPQYGYNSTGEEREVWDKLYTVRDPELPISVVDLGLIYWVEIKNKIPQIHWTVTYSGCPGKSYIKEDIIESVSKIDWVDEVRLEEVNHPPWETHMISERGKRKMAEFGLGVPNE